MKSFPWEFFVGAKKTLCINIQFSASDLFALFDFTNASALAVKRYIIVLSFVEVCKCLGQLFLFEEIYFP